MLSHFTDDNPEAKKALQCLWIKKVRKPAQETEKEQRQKENQVWY